jgi:hypothetical protein
MYWDWELCEVAIVLDVTAAANSDIRDVVIGSRIYTVIHRWKSWDFPAVGNLVTTGARGNPRRLRG